MSKTLTNPGEVKSIAADRKALFEELYAEHEEWLRGIALWLTKNEADADDLFQESIFRAFRRFDLFEEGTNFRAWVHIIMRNTFYTDRRKNNLRPTLLEVQAMEAASSAVEQSAEEAASRGVIAGPEDQVGEEFLFAMDRLPEHYRRVLELREVYGLQYREVAEQADIPLGTVMSRLSRARHMVRQHLGNLAA